MPFIIRCDNTKPKDPLGGKAETFAQLHKANLSIPRWIVVTPDAFYGSLTEEQRWAIEQTQDNTEILRILQDLSLGARLQKELEEALAELCPTGERVAVRSSALEEDAGYHSLAGQLESFLCVSPRDVPREIMEVWRSGFSQRVLAYYRERRIGLAPRAPAVLIQRMVNADTAGVVFSADPVTGRRSIAVVAAAYGLASGLVSGQCDADCFRVDREGNILARDIRDKAWAYRYAPKDGQRMRLVAVPEADARRPALADQEIRAVAEIARRAEVLFGRPQDIEWAIEGGQIYVLQSRPITSLAGLADPEGAFALWDNSNIIESYGGITTPLTFSFARRAYEEVYRQFCHLMHVPTARVRDNHVIFRCMLGLIRGRVYYNLLNWYRLLAMLPAFAFNCGFMEQMVGIKESLPEGALPKPERAAWRERVREGFRFLQIICAIGTHHFLLGRRIRDFCDRVNGALGADRPDLSRLRADELIAYYRDLERKLLTHWDAPLINDFFAMVFYGVLRKLTARWCRDGQGNLENALLCGEGGMISTEPGTRVREMAQIAAKKPGLVGTLCHGSVETILREMQTLPDLMACYQSYLDTFGDRCLDELKLESPTLHDNPLPLLRSMGHLAHQMECPELLGGNCNSGELTLRHQAEKRVQQTLAGRPISRLIYGWVLRNTRRRVRDRENLRFERTRVFGRVRMIFVELGRRFWALNRLDKPADIFYLELNDILGFVEGTSCCTNLRALAALRKAEFEEFSSTQPPANRFETRGIPYQGNSFQIVRGVQESDSKTMRGIGCCPGRTRGRVHIVLDPNNSQPPMGSILVAERTDPSWILLLPFAAGMLVERGSLLSHTAIIAREMGVPTVVSLEGLTRWVKDGDWVELDGSSGVVTKFSIRT